MFFNKKYHARWVIYEFCGIKLKLKSKSKQIDTINLILDTKYGIGNRIFAIVNAIYTYNPKNINIFWDLEDWVDESFSSLFDVSLNCKIAEYSDKNICKKWKNSRKERTIEFPQTNILTKDFVERTLFNNNITPEIEQDFKKIFSNIKPSEKVKKRINNITIPESFIALQIRNAPDWDKYGRNENLNLYIDEINKFPENTIFYISAMSKDIVDYIKNNTKHRILELPNKNYKSMIDAMADLYIMSYASKSIYSYGSTFGELAWWLSDKRQEFCIVGSDNNWKWIK